jgi:hypothetical protein
VGPQARNSIFRVQRRLPGCLLGSRTLMWLEPRMVSHGAAVLLFFA